MNSLEKEYVVDFYNTVYEQFNGTRWKAWPEIENFLSQYDSNDVGLEIGCGNGKNMHKRLNIIGIDSSIEMCKLARERTGHEVINADATSLPFVNESFDYIISIAVIHHISTIDRRQLFLSEIARVLRTNGKCMISTWIPPEKKKVENELVTWTFRHNWTKSGKDEIVHRYIHTFEQDELEDLIQNNGSFRIITTTECLANMDNHYVIIEKI